jgi:hypothetical protein
MLERPGANLCETGLIQEKLWGSVSVLLAAVRREPDVTRQKSVTQFPVLHFEVDVRRHIDCLNLLRRTTTAFGPD